MMVVLSVAYIGKQWPKKTFLTFYYLSPNLFYQALQPVSKNLTQLLVQEAEVLKCCLLTSGYSKFLFRSIRKLEGNLVEACYMLNHVRQNWKLENSP